MRYLKFSFIFLLFIFACGVDTQTKPENKVVNINAEAPFEFSPVLVKGELLLSADRETMRGYMIVHDVFYDERKYNFKKYLDKKNQPDIDIIFDYTPENLKRFDTYQPLKVYQIYLTEQIDAITFRGEFL